MVVHPSDPSIDYIKRVVGLPGGVSNAGQQQTPKIDGQPVEMPLLRA